MDTARVVQEDHGPAPRRRRRPRWLLALVAASIAAPLTSGSAIALSGGTTAAPEQAKPYVQQHYGGRGHCHHGDGAMGRMHSSAMQY
jgi:hypothetical protein